MPCIAFTLEKFRTKTPTQNRVVYAVHRSKERSDLHVGATNTEDHVSLYRHKVHHCIAHSSGQN